MSLPVEEEPEVDVAASLKGDIQYDHGAIPPRDDDDTLIETETTYMRPNDNDNDRMSDSASYTPRSPSITLPEQYSAHQYDSSHPNNRLANLTKHHRNGSTDQLGIRSVDAVVCSKSRPLDENRESPPLPVRANADGNSEATLRHQHSRSFNDIRDDRGNRAAEHSPSPSANQQSIRPHPLQTQVHREDHYYDDAAAAYPQTYFHSNRPNAPIHAAQSDCCPVSVPVRFQHTAKLRSSCRLALPLSLLPRPL